MGALAKELSDLGQDYIKNHGPQLVDKYNEGDRNKNYDIQDWVALSSALKVAGEQKESKLAGTSALQLAMTEVKAAEEKNPNITQGLNSANAKILQDSKGDNAKAALAIHALTSKAATDAHVFQSAGLQNTPLGYAIQDAEQQAAIR